MKFLKVAVRTKRFVQQNLLFESHSWASFVFARPGCVCVCEKHCMRMTATKEVCGLPSR